MPSPMIQPKISVLVPVFNGEEYLAECLESILNQDYAGFELLISDNASTDRTGEIIQKFARQDPRIRAWRTPENLGMVGNFNLCMQEARGDYLKFVLADDKLMSPSALRKMAAVMEQNPAVSLLASASHFIDEGSRPTEYRNHFGDSGFWDGKQTVLHCFETRLDNIIGEPTLTMFRKSQAGRGFDPRYRHLLDIEMWYHLLEQGRFAFLDESLCAFRLHPNQTSQFNMKAKIGVEEHLLILETYLRRPWMRERATTKMCFVQIRKLRKDHLGPRTQAMLDELKELAGPLGYAGQHLKYSVSRPMQNLGRFVRKTLRRPQKKPLQPRRN